MGPYLYRTILTALLCLSLPSLSQAQSCPATPSPFPKAAAFSTQATLPDPFVYLDGKSRVTTQEEWYQCRQPEILRLLQEYQFGYYPDHSAETVTATRTSNTLSISVAAGGKTGTFSASINLPNGASAAAPSPVVIAIGGIDNNAYLRAGVAVVTFDYTKVAPDSNGKTGAFWSLYNGKDIGALTAWAWGFHRVLDALELRVPEINSTLVGVTGCSRLGKAALAAGLFDKRITLTMPMSSGIQGLGPYRYSLSGQGENLENSKQGAPWWTNSVLGTFVNQAQRLPFDAHTIAAAIAPRAIVMDQGQSDPFVDSKGTAVVTYPAAKLVYDWLGVGKQLALAIRSGGHCDNSGYTNVLPFVLQVLKSTPTTRDYTSLSPWTAMTTAYPWSSQSPPQAAAAREAPRKRYDTRRTSMKGN
ncbi:carbohydrate esterase family 15 protein [Patellaria atrata CBS 101060]|uniref:(4-O-methyl)-D-glucuronate--lignin esterase n=1 Tax=Patellaria atrata CBS 101060 TaxID=1346257 RepID=A0A9P4SI47_9PEZI|nr:carbohydrate esterase family 15 protein [Patellaria atrata CBS 101060]